MEPYQILLKHSHSGNPATIIKNVAEIDESFLNEHPELKKEYLK